MLLFKRQPICLDWAPLRGQSSIFQFMSSGPNSTLLDDHLVCDAAALGLITRCAFDVLIVMPERHPLIRSVFRRPRPLAAGRS
jgi:hypothetical protein